jgi:thiol-disulfide isomerase/thioredoxin
MTDLATFTGIVKCSATWCQPCKLVERIFEHEARDLVTNIKTHTIMDSEQYPPSVVSVPSFLFLVDGKEVRPPVTGVCIPTILAAIQSFSEHVSKKNTNQFALPVSDGALVS